MENASVIFAEFASILKANKKNDWELCDACIDALCARFSILFVLWDGAFSFASKLDPSAECIIQYRRFVTDGVHARSLTDSKILSEVLRVIRTYVGTVFFKKSS